jgi:hypothetical protein
LVSETGSIDWCYLPEFASVFAKLLEEKKGGQFAFQVDDSYKISQVYVKDTSILKTTFSSPDASFQVYDFLLRYLKKDKSYHTPPELIRYLKVTEGIPKLKVDFNPKLEYAFGNKEIFIKENFTVGFTKADEFDTLLLYTSLDKGATANSKEISLTEDAFFLLSYNDKIELPDMESVFLDLETTKHYWLNWSSKTPKFGIYDDIKKRNDS